MLRACEISYIVDSGHDKHLKLLKDIYVMDAQMHTESVLIN